MKDAVPRTPAKRAALISSYIHIKRASTSPTVATLKTFKTEKSSWTYTSRKTRYDAMSEDEKKTVYDFWLFPSISRPSRNKKDIKRVRLGPKIYSSHMIHVLNKSQTEAFLEFRTTNLDIKITQRKFENLKPYFVRAARQQNRSNCCCRYHIEAQSMFKKCMEFRKIVLTNHYVADTNQIKVFERLSDLVDTTLCKKESQEENHKMVCLDRNCNNCGIHCLILMQEELDNSESSPDVKLERYEYVNINTKGSSCRKLMLINKTTKSGEIFNYFKDILKTFPSHQFRANWQNKQFQILEENLPQQHCIFVHDFSENYRCFDQTEIQSSYFARLEISIHVTLIYRHAILQIGGEESNDKNPYIVTEQLFVFSPDDSHDMYFTHDVRKLVEII
ncbi:unnamed protein product [Mytilus coruscus]|uniref:Uncharacterized protein n=1 Tax=Mytilus coruscus TaxID=42192 RepID=A0A6J8DGI7_MYTCO|nr:unnamed protein product [Mytilus coruscus]